MNSPAHQVKGSLSLPVYRDKVYLSPELRYTSRRTGYANNPYLAAHPATDDFVTANLTLFSHRIVPGLDFSASLYNLFDTRFSDPVGKQLVQDSLPQDGRNFRLKISYRF